MGWEELGSMGKPSLFFLPVVIQGKVVSSLDLIEVLLSLLIFTSGGKKENMRCYGDMYESIWNIEVGGGN